ncbi:calcium-binding protein [Microcystis aeruginosa]|uniref:calcium-binding protein n=1 Tax=Microcystis aeruginosa TaxID=1126 RepID=UPI0023302669|nr:calcium-binding protein [Microcystis aeruginosa]MDB9415233.1 calcium-binding protein [Microcystis aeruginosa CS-556/03]
MPITVSAPLNSSTGYAIDASTFAPSLYDYWNSNPTNIDVAFSFDSGAIGRNLTAIGLFNGTNSIWRLLNGSGQADVTANLAGYGNPFSRNYFLPAGSNTFVASTFITGPGTHILDFGGGQRITKAQNRNPIANDIVTLGNASSYFLRGANGNDTLTGSVLSDTLLGFDGNDILLGLGGTDSLDGGNGNDTLIGGAGNDSLTGGTGADRFAYNNTNQGVDTINDFTIAQGDTLTFTSAPFGGLPLGAVAANQLATAEDGVARFIYNVGTGLLQYDTNLAASGGLVGIATLTNTPAITNTQIVIV